jgi:uncharacterized membrane protein (UPF0127 family)
MNYWKLGRLLGLTILLGIVGFWYYSNNFRNHEITSIVSPVISNETLPITAIVSSPQGVDIHVRVANTDKTRELGLSHFKTLAKNEGILFSFPQVGIYPFWMKDMNFPLDIIWIDENSTIVDRVINADPSSYPKSFIPQHVARYVLEIPAGTADQYGLIVGALVTIQR